MKSGEQVSSLRAPRPVGQPGRVSWHKALILAALTAVIGVAFLSTFGYYLEEDGGLGLLFHLRGPKNTSPANVVIVSLDRMSADRLGLSYDYSKWPHSYHTRLIQALIDAGASVIAFDVFFDKSRSTQDDHILAKVIGKAGNVVLVEDLRKKIITTAQAPPGSVINGVTVEQLEPPTPELAHVAASVAPFPLPKVPVRVSQYWTFEQTGDVPTLPTVVFQIFALQAFDDLKTLLDRAVRDPEVVRAGDAVNKLALSQTRRLLSLDRDSFRNADAIIALVRSLRQILSSDTLIATRVRKYLEEDGVQSRMDEVHLQLLKALVSLYRIPASRFLNFYGPPGSITTIPYFQALRAINGNGGSAASTMDFKGKVVFIGYSDISPQKQGDFYNTVYSLPDGRDLSGVEIAATAFANLLENTPVQPLSFGTNILTILLYGSMMGLICYLFRPLVAVVCMVVISMLYLDFAALKFSTAGIWFPVVIPVAFQVPFAFTAAILWKYYDSRKMEVAHERLREVDRLKTMFLSQVSHELRAPLTSIQGFLDNMLDGLTGELKSKQREYLHRMQENTERLTRMITNLLDLSRIESGTQHFDPLPWRLFELAEEVIGQFEPVAACKRVVLALICEDPTPRILADHDKFIQILTNLLDNAIKFTPAGGKVTVTLDRPDTDHVMVTVTDTGVGISAAAMKNLFEPFYQATHDSGIQTKGLGLGLTIVKSLVEIHGGLITVTSEPGRGSEFRIVVPVLADGEQHAFFPTANS